MLNALARGMFLLFLAVMLVTWAMSLGKTEPAPPSSGPVIYYQFA